MPQPAPTLDAAVRVIRIVHGVLLFSMILYAFTAERIGMHEPHDIRVIWIAFLALCPAEIGIAFYFRLKCVQPAAELLQTQPGDASALGRWRAGNIITFVIAEAIMLYGFALRFLGGTVLQALPFYAAAVALMILWWPRRP
jgi:hypothetical protein